jgi:hypothetical protein
MVHARSLDIYVWCITGRASLACSQELTGPRGCEVENGVDRWGRFGRTGILVGHQAIFPRWPAIVTTAVINSRYYMPVEML